jgi:hypothetical protein
VFASPFTVQTWRTATLWVGAIYLLAAAVLLRGILRKSRPARPAVPEVVAGVLLVGLGVWLRYARVATLHNGRLTMDEAWIARTYVGSIVNLEPVLAGVTDMTYAFLLDCWYGVVGLAPLSARYFNATLGALGLGFLFAALRRLLDARSALWATVFLALSTYAVYFSIFAIEHVSTLSFLPLNALLLARWIERPSPLRGILLGLGIGVSYFTFAGLVLGYFCLASCCTVMLLAEILWRGRLPEGGLPSARAIAWVMVPFLAVFGGGLSLHHRLFPGAALFQGGGALAPSEQAYRENTPLLLHELFVGSRSWNLPFHSMPFIETTLWPFILLGAVLLWRRRPGWPWRGLVLSALALFAFLPISGANVGMRRGVYLLFPTYVLAGAGAAGIVGRLGGLAGTFAILGAIVLPTYHQLTFGWREGVNSNYGTDFGGAPIPDPLLIEALRSGDVIMSGGEFTHGWDQARHVYFAKLLARHGVVPRDRTLKFIDKGDDRSPVGPQAVLLTWQPSQSLDPIARPRRLCVRRPDLRQAQPGVPTALHLVDAAHAGADDACPWSEGGDRWVTSCARLGGRFALSRLVHRFSCQSAYCGAERPDFVFVEPGSISFALKRPPGDDAVRLLVKVRDMHAVMRLNTVSVNGREVGRMEGSGTTNEPAFSFDVPPEAQGRSPIWQVTIGPGDMRIKSGFDVKWAALVPADGPLTDGDVCPERFCIGDGAESVCEPE